MVKRENITMTENGGIAFEMTDESGDTRRVVLEPNDDGTLTIESQAPDGTSKRGKMDPTGGGSKNLGV